MNEILQSEPSQTLRLHSMDLFSRSSIFIGTQQLDTLVSRLMSDLSVTLDVCSPLYLLIFVGCFTCVSDGFKLVCWGSIVEWRSLILKNPLVIGGIRTQVLADIMAIAGSAR